MSITVKRSASVKGKSPVTYVINTTTSKYSTSRNNACGDSFMERKHPISQVAMAMCQVNPNFKGNQELDHLMTKKHPIDAYKEQQDKYCKEFYIDIKADTKDLIERNYNDYYKIISQFSKQITIKNNKVIAKRNTDLQFAFRLFRYYSNPVMAKTLEKTVYLFEKEKMQIIRALILAHYYVLFSYNKQYNTGDSWDCIFNNRDILPSLCGNIVYYEDENILLVTNVEIPQNKYDFLNILNEQYFTTFSFLHYDFREREVLTELKNTNHVNNNIHRRTVITPTLMPTNRLLKGKSLKQAIAFRNLVLQQKWSVLNKIMLTQKYWNEKIYNVDFVNKKLRIK